MRFVIVGAGAIGGVIGSRLFETGHEVVLVARGKHGEILRQSGLTMRWPDGGKVFRIPTVDDPRELRWSRSDVVLLAVKSQDTSAAIGSLSHFAQPETPVVCLQNGIDNERSVLRLFSRVYGAYVLCHAAHLQPGLVEHYSAPLCGIVDVGRFPAGIDDLADTLAFDLTTSSFSSNPQPNIMRWKRAKLLANLPNVVEAVCGATTREGALEALLVREGEDCFRAAGMDYASAGEVAARVGKLLDIRPIGEERRPGASSWQSLARRTGNIESDYLNGEIVLLGRLHGVPTPANELLTRFARQIAATRSSPGSVSEEEVHSRLTSH